MRFSNYGLKWEVSNKNGFFSPSAYQSEPNVLVSPILAAVLKRDREDLERHVRSIRNIHDYY
jgi:hypothetical protein